MKHKTNPEEFEKRRKELEEESNKFDAILERYPPRWLEGKPDCPACKGTGLNKSGRDMVNWNHSIGALIARGHYCRACQGTGKKNGKC